MSRTSPGVVLGEPAGMGHGHWSLENPQGRAVGIGPWRTHRGGPWVLVLGEPAGKGRGRWSSENPQGRAVGTGPRRTARVGRGHWSSENPQGWAVGAGPQRTHRDEPWAFVLGEPAGAGHGHWSLENLQRWAVGAGPRRTCRGGLWALVLREPAGVGCGHRSLENLQGWAVAQVDQQWGRECYTSSSLSFLPVRRSYRIPSFVLWPDGLELDMELAESTILMRVGWIGRGRRQFGLDSMGPLVWFPL